MLITFLVIMKTVYISLTMSSTFMSQPEKSVFFLNNIVNAVGLVGLVGMVEIVKFGGFVGMMGLVGMMGMIGIVGFVRIVGLWSHS